jgi:hypothetical protein
MMEIWLCLCGILQLDLLRSGTSVHVGQIKKDDLFEMNPIETCRL